MIFALFVHLPGGLVIILFSESCYLSEIRGGGGRLSLQTEEHYSVAHWFVFI